MQVQWLNPGSVSHPTLLFLTVFVVLAYPQEAAHNPSLFFLFEGKNSCSLIPVFSSSLVFVLRFSWPFVFKWNIFFLISPMRVCNISNLMAFSFLQSWWNAWFPLNDTILSSYLSVSWSYPSLGLSWRNTQQPANGYLFCVPGLCPLISQVSSTYIYTCVSM